MTAEQRNRQIDRRSMVCDWLRLALATWAAIELFTLGHKLGWW